MKSEAISSSEATKPLAPPPKPGQAQGNGTPDFFSSGAGGSLSLEPNPFEQSFGGGGQVETPGGPKLPSVAALTSPASLIPGPGTTPFNWPGGSLRTGPLSPAMLSGPANDYFGEAHHIRGGFPTPNESSLRTGLTPGGSGSMFPAPSPSSAILAQLAGSGATPGTLEFHRTALSAKRELENATGKVPATTQAAEASDVTAKAEAKPASGPFDPHDNDAANGLYMLAQGRNGTATTSQYPPVSQPASHAHPAPVAPQSIETSPQMESLNGGSIGSGGSIRAFSEVSGVSDESEQPKPTTRGRGKKNAAATSNGRRKADDLGTGRTPKKAKGNSGAAFINGDMLSDDDMKDESGGPKSKMTEDEKRKNFLERNR
jgi:ATF/CREB family transcription factor